MLTTKNIYSIISLITIFTVSIPNEVHSENILVQDNFSSTLICLKDGDKNKGHGNDLYVEFGMNIDSIGQAEISGDFDIDNPGNSLDKQLNIMANNEKILWTTLDDGQKQQVKHELRKQICLAANIFAD